MSRVYIAHEALRKGRPIYDTSAAARYGEVVVLTRTSEGRFLDEEGEELDGGLGLDHMERVAGEVSDRMTDYAEEDHVLLAGNQAICAMVAAIAADRANGLLRMLVWNGAAFRYEPIEVRLWEADEVEDESALEDEELRAEDVR